MEGESDFVLRDEVVGLQAELAEARFQRNKAKAAIDDLHAEMTSLDGRLASANAALDEALRVHEVLRSEMLRLEADLIAVRQSKTWRVGKVVMGPFQLLKRRFR